jgi:glycosyltransferase involved in cell wall biosynthesis
MAPAMRKAGPLRALRVVLVAPFRVLYFFRMLFDRRLDGKPESLINGAINHARRRGRTAACLVLSWQAEPALLHALLDDPRVGAVGVKDAVETLLSPELASSPRVGRYFHHGDWKLPRPCETLYFVGSWRLMSRRMHVEAVRAGVEELWVRFGTVWMRAPTQSLRRFAPLARAASRARLGVQNAVAALLRHPAMRAVQRTFFPDRFLTLEETFDRLLANPAPHRNSAPGRVILVAGNLSPGGAERQVANTLIGLKNAGHGDVRLLAHNLASGPGQADFHMARVCAAGAEAREITRAIASLKEPGVPEALRKARALPVNLALDIANLVREFEAARPEIVHCWLDWDNVRAGVAAALAGVPRIILSGRNLNPSHYDLYQPYMDPAYKALARLKNVHVLNNSRAGADSYADWIGIPRARVTVLHNGLDFPRFDPLPEEGRAAARSALGLDPGAFVVGGVFRFDSEKRPLLWIDAAQKIARDAPNAQFVVFGHGGFKGAMEARIRQHGLGARFVLPGLTKDPLAAMAMMDVFLLTSFGEGLPNVLIEAQSAGVPVVTTKVGGAAETLDEGVTGWAVESDDPEAIAAAVLALHADPEKIARARARAPGFVRDRFAMDRMVAETFSVYGISPSTPSLPAGQAPAHAGFAAAP